MYYALKDQQIVARYQNLTKLLFDIPRAYWNNMPIEIVDDSLNLITTLTKGIYDKVEDVERRFPKKEELL